LGRDDFSKIPNGGPGIENRLHKIHEFGARRGRITLNRMGGLLAPNPAKLFRRYPRQGTTAVGSGGGVVGVDPERRARPAPRAGTRCPRRLTTRRSTTTSSREPR